MWLRFNKLKLEAGLVCALSLVLYVIAFPPFGVAEAAYVCLMPFIGWATRLPDKKLYMKVAALTSFLIWLAIIVWLRHVTYMGWLFLAAFLAFFLWIWLYCTYFFVGKLWQKGLGVRALSILGLCAAWVLLEWMRVYLFTGFPWALMANTQWERPVVLQLAAWTGVYGVSALIVWMNLCFAAFLYSRFVLKARKQLSVELLLGLGALFAVSFLYTSQVASMRVRTEPFRVGLIQPYIPASLKWTQEQAIKTLDVLEDYTVRVVHEHQPAIVIWPEAALPSPLIGHSFMEEWTESLAADLHVPIMTGSLNIEEGKWYNGIVAITPEEGILPDYYTKIRRVPFGEYMPFRKYIGAFFDKVIPLPEDIYAVDSPRLIPMYIKGERLNWGGVVCYEDIFPYITRRQVLLGADLFVVVTNDAWYYEEAGAYQHASSSVLRAVETGRVVVRCGNGGWSGWIDERGNIRQLLKNGESIYFSGYGVADVSFEKAIVGQQTFYVRHGNWIVVTSLVVFALVSMLYFKTKNFK